MRFIGLTGGIATGKSRVAELLRQSGIPVLDADQISRHLTRPDGEALPAIRQAFGPNVFDSNGQLNRKSLAQRVFQNPTQLSQLEKIMHPLIQTEVQRLRADLANQGHPVVVYDVPLLFEKNLEKQFDSIVVVACSEPLQKVRLKDRDQLSDQEIQQRMQVQIPIADKVKRANWVIHNEGSLQDLATNTQSLITWLKT